jgi:hypothetical protein
LLWTVKCPVCNEDFHIAGLGAHLAQKHRGNLRNYPELKALMQKYIREVIAPKYKGRPSPKKGKTWEELYGPAKAQELKERLKERNRRRGIFGEGWRGEKNPMADPEVRARWEKVVRSKEYRRKKSQIMKKLMKDKSYKEWWYERFIEKTYGAVTKVAEMLRQQGYHVIPLHHGYPVPDLIVVKDGKVYAVEVVSNPEKINPDKYNSVTFYNDIWWIVYRGEEDG